MDYKKIIVIGCSGAGKSTFSKQLAEITGLPLYNLDRVYWLPDTSHLERPDFIKKQKKIMRGDEWIIDGNYRKTIKYRIKECELCYFFDMPTEICIEGVLKRDKKREDIACELEPDEELINDIKAYPEIARPKALKLFEKYPEVRVITFKSHSEVNEYLDKLRRDYGFNV
ncbi:MAG: adenylate kinase [Eubacterium sp.]|nr:adenylate kinase [Eubacterium sp.]